MEILLLNISVEPYNLQNCKIELKSKEDSISM